MRARNYSLRSALQRMRRFWMDCRQSGNNLPGHLDMPGLVLTKSAWGKRPSREFPLVACVVSSVNHNLECKVADTRLVNKYNLIILEVLKAWTDPAQKNPKTIHHHGYGRFAVDGEMIKLKSRMR
jgi:hypothetical protein